MVILASLPTMSGGRAGGVLSCFCVLSLSSFLFAFRFLSCYCIPSFFSFFPLRRPCERGFPPARVHVGSGTHIVILLWINTPSLPLFCSLFFLPVNTRPAPMRLPLRFSSLFRLSPPPRFSAASLRSNPKALLMLTRPGSVSPPPRLLVWYHSACTYPITYAYAQEHK